jgi:hypothetical protein
VAAKIGNPPTSIQAGILRGIDSGLDAFGENVRTVFYLEMERYYRFDRTQILEYPEEFVGSISRFFTVGSALVERTIGREILRVFDIPACASITILSALEIVKRHPNLGSRESVSNETTVIEDKSDVGEKS